MAERKEKIIFELEDQVTDKLKEVNSSIEKVTQNIKKLNQINDNFTKIKGTLNASAADIKSFEDQFKSLNEVLNSGDIKKSSEEFKYIKDQISILSDAIKRGKEEFNAFDNAAYNASVELKELNAEQRKLSEERIRIKELNNQFRRMKSEIDRVANNVRGLTNIFLGLGLSLLFAGLALRNFGLKVLRSLFNTFQQATEGTTAYAETLGRLTAAFEFLKYTIIETFLQSELGEKIINKIVETLGRLADWIQQNPNIATAIVGGSAGLVILGTALGIIGQIIAGISVIPQIVSNSIKSLGGLGRKIIALVKGPEFLTTFDDVAKQLGKTGNAASQAGSKVGGISRFLKFAAAGSFLRPLKGLFRVLGRVAIVLGVLELLFNFFKGFFEVFNKDVEEATQQSEDYAKGIEVLSGVLEFLKSVLMALWETFNLVFDIINKIAEAFGELVAGSLKTAIEMIGAFTNGYEEARNSGKGILESAMEGGKGAAGAFNTGAADMLNTGQENVQDVTDMISNSPGNQQKKWWQKLNPFTREFARGGIVTSPTTALIGEAGPEAVIPLSRMGETNVGGINVTVNVSQTNASPEMIGNAVLDTLQQSLRRKGLSAGL